MTRSGRSLAAVAAVVLGLASPASTAGSREAGDAGVEVMTMDFRLRIKALFPRPHNDGIVGFALVDGDQAHAVHRILLDKQRGLYYGYDIRVTAASPRAFNVEVGPLGAAAARHFLEAGWADLCPTCEAPRAVSTMLQRFPGPRQVHPGDTITLDLLRDEATGQVASDEITVDVSPAALPQPAAPVPSIAPPADLKAENVWLQLSSPALRINGSLAFEDERGASVQGDVLFVEMPDHGRVFLSLAPQSGCGFSRIGIVAGNTLTVTAGADQYEWISTGPIATPGLIPPFNAMQSWHVWGRHEPDYKPFDGRYSIGAGGCAIGRARPR